MANSKWFDSNVYMANKLALVKAGDPAGNWTMDKVVQAFASSGFVGTEGAEAHFMQFGQFEDVAPNAYFNPTEYYRAKAAIVNSKQDAPKTVTDAEAAFVKGAINSLGLGAWGHYTAFGSNEKVNPSNGFDTDAYVTAKTDALNAIAGGKQYTPDEVYAAFKGAGVSALEHFMQFGGNGSGEVTDGYKGSIPDAFKVPEAKQVASSGTGGGSVFTLTASPSDVGVADTFNAPLYYNDNAGGTFQTLNTGDKLTGTGSNPTLNATLTGNAAPTMTGVSTLNLTAHDTANLNLVNATGVKHINSVGSLAGLTVSNVNALVESVGMSNTLSDMTVTFADAALSGATDALTLKLNNVGSSSSDTDVRISPTGGSTVNGLEIINIVTSGGASRLSSLTADVSTKGTSLATINVTGDKALHIDDALDESVVTVDASGMTEGGSIRLELDGVQNHKITGSLGDDRVTLSNLTSKDVVNLGDGSGDTLIVKGVAASTGAETIAGLGSNITNVETLGIVSGKGGINATTFDSTDVAGITGITISASDSGDAFVGTINNAVLTSKGGNGVTLNAGVNFDTIGITVKGTATTGTDHLTINLGDNAANTTGFDTDAITANGIETITINVGDAADHTIASVTSTSLKAVNITGGVTGTTTEITAGIDADIDASDFLGNLILLGAASGGTISTQYVEMGAGDDTFTFSTGTPGAAVAVANPVNIVTGGAGADTFVFAATSNTFATASFTAKVTGSEQFDRIEDLDFGGVSTNANTGNDFFQFNDGGAGAVARGKSTVVNDGQVVELSETTYTTLQAALTAVVGLATVVKKGGGTATGVEHSGANTTNLVGLFSYKGEIFLIGEEGSGTATAAYADGTNYIVALTGVTGTLDAWDIEVV